jgi:disulfide bond formation protein DsbB
MNDQLQSSAYARFEMPPAPPVFHEPNMEMKDVSHDSAPPCNMCGTDLMVSMRQVNKYYVPPAAYLLFIIGFIGPVLILLFMTRHQLTLAFCEQCWVRTRKGFYVDVIGAVFIVIFLLGGVGIQFVGPSLLNFVVALGAAFGIMFAGRSYRKKNSPKFKKIGRHQVTVITPSGEIIFER